MNALLVLLVVLVGSVAASQRPHIITYIIDDLGWTDVGYRPGSGMLTPTLDSLAASGIILDRYYTQPVCSPSRTALLQGRYPFRTGLQDYTTIQPASPAHMYLDLPTIPEVLGKAGYDCHAVGKWHCGYASFNYTPTQRGFASHSGYYQGMIDYYNKTFSIPTRFVGGLDITGYDWWHNTSVARSEADATTYSQLLMMNEVERVLQVYNASGHAEQNRPLFLYLANQIVHIPLESPGDEWMDRCRAANTSAAQDPLRLIYCAMLAFLDDQLAQLVAALKDYGLWDNTLLLVTTDNGGDPPSGSYPPSAGCNYPLRAGKGRVYEGGVRSIGFVNGGDGVVPAARRGSTFAGLAHITDWFPTFLRAANVSAALQPTGLDGFDLTDAILHGVPTPRTSIPLDINLNISYPPNSGRQIGLLTDDGWKLVVDQVKGPALVYDGYYPPLPAAPIPANTSATGLYLFNVFKDPNEHNNVYDAYPDQVARLNSILNGYLQSGYRRTQFNSFVPTGAPLLHNGVWAPFLKE